MPAYEAPNLELGSAPQTPSIIASPSPSEISNASSPEPQNIRATPLFRALAMPPPEPEQPPGQEELERRLPGYRRIVIPRELTLIELLKQSSGVTSDEDVLQIREAKLRVVAERVGLRRLHVLAPRLRSLILDGSAIGSLRDLGIGLIHLKVLSVNRCGLSSLDGVWGLSALRELQGTGNRFVDLQPLAALQKLHTLNLANNPIAESNRIWTLGVCGSLRRLTLRGTPVADSQHYRSRVAAALPMLLFLDDLPLNPENNSDGEFGPASSSSDSGGSDAEVEPDLRGIQLPPAEPGPSSSSELDTTSQKYAKKSPEGDVESYELKRTPARHRLRVRPATTEGAGLRPTRPQLPQRPQTALSRPHIDAPTRLQILNTLMAWGNPHRIPPAPASWERVMLSERLIWVDAENDVDEEWRCSGSKLTSHGAVCGNLARALRRPSTGNSRRNSGKILAEQTMEDASRALAAEIPRGPRLEDWAKFKLDTGIDIDIDFNERPRDINPSAAIERLDRIEKETLERLNEEDFNLIGTVQRNYSVAPNPPATFANCSMALMSDLELWRDENPTLYDPINDADALFNDLNGMRPIRDATVYDSNELRE